MKKVIVAAAGLMLAGVMTSTAFADPGVSFSGDARARFKYFDDYENPAAHPSVGAALMPGAKLAAMQNAPNSKKSWFESRARLAVVGETKGGAYAKARFTLANGRWSGTTITRSANNVNVDYAYLGVPLGPVTVEAGAYDDRGITPFTIFAQDADTLQFIYEAGETKVTGFMDMVLEDSSWKQNDDVMAFGLVLNQGFSCGATLDAGIRYQHDPRSATAPGVTPQVTPQEGIIAGLDVSGEFGGMTLAGGLGYKEKDFTDTGDDGYGLWARLDAPVGAATATVIAGATFDGYTPEWGEFDAFYVFGDFTMISLGTDATPIPGKSKSLSIGNIGHLGDAFWGVLRGAYKASEALNFEAQIAYIDIDYGQGYDTNAFEIGAQAKYTILDGASLTAMVGYADIKDLDVNPLAFALSLDVKF